MSDFSEAQALELERLIDGVRTVIDAAVSLNAPAETLAALADQAEALGASLAPFRGKKPLPLFPKDLQGELPFSAVTGYLNPLAPRLLLSFEGDTMKRAVARVRFPMAYEGPPSFVHGGMVSAMFDQLLGYAARASGVGGMTASLTVTYRKPTPLERELRFEAWIERVDDRKVVARGECRLEGELLTECEGLFVRINAEKARKIWGPPKA